MANFSAFENYGKRLPQDHNEEPIIQREEAVFNLEKVGKDPNFPDKEADSKI